MLFYFDFLESTKMKYYIIYIALKFLIEQGKEPPAFMPHWNIPI